jgi:hypothetical protein
MISKSKLAVALGVAGAIALSMSSAEARTKHRAARAQATVQDTLVGGVNVQPSFGRAYNYEPGFAGGGINFRDGRGGANYNPNQ